MHTFKGEELKVCTRVAVKNIQLYLQTGCINYTLNTNQYRELTIKEQVWLAEISEAMNSIKEINCNYNSVDECIGWLLIHTKLAFEYMSRDLTHFNHELEQDVHVTAPIEGCINLVQTVLDIRLNDMKEKKTPYQHPVYRGVATLLEEQRAREIRIQRYKEMLD